MAAAPSTSGFKTSDMATTPVKLLGVASCLPPYDVEQEELKQFARRFFGGALPDIERLLAVFDHAGVERRQLSVPVSWFAERHDFKSRNEAWLEHAQVLSRRAIDVLLSRFDLAPPDIDHLVFVSSTGLATPTVDARLLGAMGFRSDTLRTPIFGLGCAGGALGLVHAAQLLQGNPCQKLLLVNVELCALTFQTEDLSKANLVATALFGQSSFSGLNVDADLLTSLISNSRINSSGVNTS